MFLVALVLYCLGFLDNLRRQDLDENEINFSSLLVSLFWPIQTILYFSKLVFNELKGWIEC
jgi:hypothetical protein